MQSDPVNSKLNARTANKKAGCMLQIDQNIGETLLYENPTAVSSAKSQKPLIDLAFAGGDGEDTVAYQLERHAEVKTYLLQSSVMYPIKYYF